MSWQIISNTTERIPWEIVIKKLVELYEQIKKSEAWNQIEDSDALKQLIKWIQSKPDKKPVSPSASDEAVSLSQLYMLVEDLKTDLDAQQKELSTQLQSHEEYLNSLNKKIDELHSGTENMQRSIKNVHLAMWICFGAVCIGSFAMVITIAR